MIMTTIMHNILFIALYYVIIYIYLFYNHWASEASPTLGCSIEISRDIYMYVYMSICLVCQIN